MWLGKIMVTPKKGVLDPQGDVVKRSLEAMGYRDFHDVRLGKFLQVRVGLVDREEAWEKVDEICRTILSNPVIEEYQFELVEEGQ